MPEVGYARPFPQVPLKEVYRYMGYKGRTPGRDIQSRVEAVMEKLRGAAQPRLLYQRFPLVWQKGNAQAAGFALQGQDILNNLRGCGEVYLIAATLGSGVDRLITRLALDSSADMVILQAVAAASLEEVLDQEEQAVKEQLRPQGLSLRPRFSPGYGDMPLSMQPRLLSALSAPRLLGLSVTDSLMLTPQKSVTAFAGICPLGEERVTQGGCGACAKEDCALRQDKQQEEA